MNYKDKVRELWKKLGGKPGMSYDQIDSLFSAINKEIFGLTKETVCFHIEGKDMNKMVDMTEEERTQAAFEVYSKKTKQN